MKTERYPAYQTCLASPLSGVEHDGTVAERSDIQSRAEVVQREAGPSIRIRVSIDKNHLRGMDLRPGMSVTAKVYCGQKPLGYVWLHEVWEWIERKVLF